MDYFICHGGKKKPLEKMKSINSDSDSGFGPRFMEEKKKKPQFSHVFFCTRQPSHGKKTIKRGGKKVE